MKTLNTILLFALAAGFVMFTSCKNNVSSEDDEEAEIVNEVDVELPADSGEVGMVINAREIFRKGYTATEAEVELLDYPDFNQTLEIHPVTNVAALRIPNEDLTEDEQNAFASGVAVEITIFDENKNELAEYFDEEQVLDDTNTPVTIETQLDYNVPPVRLREEIPYYIQPEEPIPGDGNWDEGAVLQANTTRLYNFAVPPADHSSTVVKYFFSPASDSSYYILRSNHNHEPQHYFRLDGSELIVVQEGTNSESSAIEFVLDQDEDGWVRIREAGTSRYLTITEGSSSDTDHRKALRLRENTNHRFRFISANIEWDATDQGTEYNQAVIPNAEIEFAYEATIRNCSSGTLTEEVGVTKSRTSTRELVTSESLELYAGAEASIGITTGVSAGVSVPGVGDVSASVEVSSEFTFTTSATTTTENTLANENSVTSEVSRVRTLEVPPFSGTEVYDAVRVIKDARVPYTQVLRIRGQYQNGPALTGDEIMTQMMANFAGGVPLKVGDDYVDIGLSGTVHINEMFETETGADDLPDACD
jgi:hypothetical protein